MVKVYNIYIDVAYFENGLKLKNLRVCCVGCKVKLHGNYSTLGLVKTENWACKLKMENRTNMI